MLDDKRYVGVALKEMEACLYAQDVLVSYQRALMSHMEDIRDRVRERPIPPEVIPLGSLIDHIVEQLPGELEKTHRILGTYNNE